MATEIGQNLGLRAACDRLFNKITSLNEKEVTIDFTGVRTISRSFAHQYLKRKKELEGKIRISEVNMPNNVKMMFDVVMTTRKTPMDVKTVKIDISSITY